MSTEVTESIAPIVVSLAIARLQPDGFFKTGQSFCRKAFLGQGDAPIVISLGPVRLMLQAFLETSPALSHRRRCNKPNPRRKSS